MPERSSLDPTGRFTGLAQTYSQFRPGYPPHSIDFIVTRCGLGPESLLVDVGCGTGIASRLFAARRIRVIGIEPNADMRCEAVSTAGNDEAVAPVEYTVGQAEATGLPASCADAVLSAQAFHWFEPEPTLAEFHRILKPGGWVVLMWNERDERDPATAAYGDVIRTAAEASLIETTRQKRSSDRLRTSRWFRKLEQITFHNQQALDAEGLLGRAFSASYAPREESQRATWIERLTRVFDNFEQDGRIVLRYQTTIYAAQRAEDPA